MASDEAKLLKQIEFYFSDSNYPKDKFLRAQASQNEEGFVPLSVIATFQRMKQMGATAELLADVVRRSEALELNKDATMVKRVKPLPEEDDSIQRSIYSKGWPETATIEDAETYFAQYGKVLSVRIRRRPDRKPKDSIFVEFSTREEAAAANGDTGRAPFKEQAITTKMRADYHAQKKEERKKRQQESKLKRKQPEQPSKPEAAAPAAGSEGAAAAEGSEAAGDGAEGATEKADEAHPTGVVLRLTGVGANVDREALKAAFGKYGNVVFVDFSRGDTDGYVRFETADAASKAVSGVPEDKLELGGQVPQVALVQGEAEEEYWKRVRESKKKAKGASGRGGRGGRGGKRGGGRGRGAKRQKTGE